MRVRFRNLRRITASLLFIALSTSGNLQAIQALAAGKPKDEKQVVGQLVATGSVTINDKKAITGTSVFNNSKLSVACASGNRAIINLGKLGRIEMAPGTQMVLKFSDGIVSGDLAMGKVIVNTPAGVKVAINTPEGISASDGKDASVVAATTQRGVRCVPVVVPSQSNSSIALSSGALAAILLGAGGAAIAGAAVSSQSQASNIIP